MFGKQIPGTVFYDQKQIKQEEQMLKLSLFAMQGFFTVIFLT